MKVDPFGDPSLPTQRRGFVLRFNGIEGGMRASATGQAATV
jgi:hypothetical protein